MNKFCLLLILLPLCFIEPVAAQSEADTLHIRETTLGDMYYYHNEHVKFWKVDELVASNAKALTLWGRGKICTSFSWILGFAGGFLVGYPVGTYLANNSNVKQRWWLAGIGAGVIAGAVGLEFVAKNYYRRAIKQYNSAIRASSYKVELSPMMMSVKFIF
jgi:hypothetical protein